MQIKLGLVLAGALLVQSVCAAPEIPDAAATGRAADPTESNIARVAADMLERLHFSRQPFDAEISERFFERYLNALDMQRLHFIQSDLDEFSKYRTNLHILTRRGDTAPAHEIYARFVKRVQQRADFARDLIDNETFEFTGEDRYTPNRRELPRPADMEEARRLWRQHLRYEYLQEKLADKEQSDGQIVEKLTGRYNRLERNIKEMERDEVFQVYLSSLARVYDPHSDYMDKRQFENFAISMKLSLFGIGALLQSEDGYCRIRELVPGGPAERSKQLKPNDRIIAVAQGDGEPVDVVDMKLSRVVELIRGEKDTEVRLTVIPANQPDVRRVISIIRDEIPLEDQEAKAKIIDMPGHDGEHVRLGVIDLPSFYADMGSGRSDTEKKSTTSDVKKLLQKLKDENVEGVILDLRRNGGGSLEEAIALTGVFIEPGPVVQIKHHTGRIFSDSATEPGVFYDGPLIVLTSRFSASASEILAGALQDYGRALIVGDSGTHGKGTVQSLEGIAPQMERVGLPYQYDPGALKLTIRKFYRASGSSTQLKGVIPDIVLPSVNNYADVGEASLENPMAWDEVTSAKYRNHNRITPHLTGLKKRSAKRIAADRDFDYVREDIEEYKQFLADRSVSLNEEERRRERDEAKERREQRRAERQARTAPDYTVYEITLKNADDPGLPEPMDPAADLLAAHRPDEDLPDDEPLADDPAELDDPDEAKDPAFDVTLDETKRILVDLITLSSKDPRALSRTQ